MRVTIVAVGKLKETYWRDAAQEYLKRLGPYANIAITEIPDQDVTADEARAVATESEAILRAIPDAARVIALDLRGKQRSSEEFSDHLGDLMVGGTSHVTFVIGGAAGLGTEVLARSDERMSFGPLTFPHQMMRVVLLEQLYRAFRIMRNEPYHR